MCQGLTVMLNNGSKHSLSPICSHAGQRHNVTKPKTHSHNADKGRMFYKSLWGLLDLWFQIVKSDVLRLCWLEFLGIAVQEHLSYPRLGITILD